VRIWDLGDGFTMIVGPDAAATFLSAAHARGRRQGPSRPQPGHAEHTTHNTAARAATLFAEVERGASSGGSPAEAGRTGAMAATAAGEPG
jgi:hypothetical protein